MISPLQSSRSASRHLRHSLNSSCDIASCTARHGTAQGQLQHNRIGCLALATRALVGADRVMWLGAAQVL